MMSRDSKICIISIIIVIPLVSFLIWDSDNTKTIADLENQRIILTSFYPLYEFTNAIGKEKVQVFSLIPFGIEPHDWEPSIQDLQRMQQAELIIVNGIGFEKWIDDLQEIDSDVVIVDASATILLNNEIEKVSDHFVDNNNDPHIWLNPIFAKIQIKTIADNLKVIDSDNAKYYEKNANEYINELSQLDEKIKKEITKCSKKDFYAFHNAFSYFANEYGLIQHTIISGNDPHEEATPKTLEKLIQDSRELGINVIFSEEGIDSRLSYVIANEIGAKVLVLDPIEIGNENLSYLTRMEKNVENLKVALCS